MSSTQVSTPADVTWEGGTTDSKIVTLSGRTICGFFFPAGFAGTTLKVKVTYKDRSGQASAVKMIDSTGADVSYTVAASRYLKVNPADFAGVDEFQLVSSANEAAGTVVKAATREMT